jgi:hypothetical protein
VQLPPIEMTVESDGSDPEAGMADFAERIEPCEQHLQETTSTFSDVDTTGIVDSLLEYAQCMRSHGVDMPDPDFSSNGGVIALGGEDMDAFEAADSECRHLLADLGIGG